MQETATIPTPAPARNSWLTVRSLFRVPFGRWRWLLGVVALGVALYSEQIVEKARTEDPGGVPPQASWLLFGLAALLFVVAAWPVTRLLPAQSMSMLADMPGRRRWLFLGPFILALFFAGAAVPLFIGLDSKDEATRHNWLVNNGSWLFYILSLLLFALAFIVWERTAHRPTQRPEYIPGEHLPRSVEWVLILGLFGLALLLRMSDLNTVPPGIWFDEAQNGIVAKQLLSPDAVHVVYLGERTQMGTLYFYFLGWVLKVFGSTVWPLRLLPALAGSLLVPMIYLLASRLYGWRAGLAAAGLLAVSVWNITFSRFGMVSMSTVALDVAVYLCVVQAIRTGRLGYYAGAGVLLGLSLQGYYVSRLVPVVLLAVLIHQLVTYRMRLVRAVRVGMLMFAVGVILGFLPVAVFASQNWDTYNSRISEASIFSPAGSDNKPDAFNISLTKHALMFNFQGDINGRHNLPGRPMLDWVTAALFFAGLGACVLRAWRWQYFFPVVWFVAATAGGVLSLVFEAPQSHRTLENSVVTALLGGIFLGEVWQMVSRAFAPVPQPATVPAGEPEAMLILGETVRPKRPIPFPKKSRPATTLPVRKAPAVVATTTLPVRAKPGVAPVQGTTATIEQPMVEVLPIAEPQPVAHKRYTRRQAIAMIASAVSLLSVIAWVATANAYRYFEVQAKDRGVWREMYTAETETGRVLAANGQSRDIYVSPVYYKLPPSDYLAPNSTAIPWGGMHTLPLTAAPGRDIVLVLDPQSSADIAAIERMYPHASFDPLRAPGSDRTPLMYTITIPASDISALFGVHASLYDQVGQPAREEKTLSSLEYSWDSPGVKSGALRMTSTLMVDRFQDYSFSLESAGGPSDPKDLLVDGYKVSASTPISLGVGLHSVVVTDTVTTPKGTTRVTWTGSDVTPGTIPATSLYDPRKIEPHGLLGLYRSGGDFQVAPKLARVDPVISMYFQVVPIARPYTVEWVGKLYIPQDGNYGLTIEQLTSSRLFIDGKQVIENNAQNSALDVHLDLTRGWHDIRFLYVDAQNYSHVYLYWTPPGRELTIIPSAFLRPAMGTYADLESGSLPTISDSNGTQLAVDRGSAQPVPTQPSSQPGPIQPPVQPTIVVSGTPIKPSLVLGAGSDAPLSGPFASTVDDKGNIYIYTDRDGKVHKLDHTGKELLSWVVPDVAGKPLAEGSALLVRDDKLQVLDSEASDLVSFDFKGKPAGRTHLCSCYYPRGISQSRDGNLWVADTGGGKVVKVSPQGALLETLGTRGSNTGQFIEPASVWESSQGVLFVADVGNGRVQTFGPDLKPITAWAVGESVARDGNRLTGNDAGNVLVTETQSKAVVAYDSAGKELGRWTYSKDGVVFVPAGIAPASNGSFVVLYPKDNIGVVAALP